VGGERRQSKAVRPFSRQKTASSKESFAVARGTILSASTGGAGVKGPSVHYEVRPGKTTATQTPMKGEIGALEIIVRFCRQRKKETASYMRLEKLTPLAGCGGGGGGVCVWGGGGNARSPLRGWGSESTSCRAGRLQE